MSPVLNWWSQFWGSLQDAVTCHRGKWSDRKVPHRGWRYLSIEDLGEPARICDMCESQEIRYVHYMEHDDYPEIFAVGCICAGHMEQDLESARQRDRMMVSRAGKRRRWLTREWRVSTRGNEWIQADGYRVTVYLKAGAWGVTVGTADDSRVQHGPRRYATSDKAKLAGFDIVTGLLARREARGD